MTLANPAVEIPLDLALELESYFLPYRVITSLKHAQFMGLLALEFQTGDTADCQSARRTKL